MIGAIAEAARGEWIRVARQRLRTSSRAYIAGISEVEHRGSEASIKLRGWLPNALEEGHAPFDMKPGFLRSPNVKRTARGRPYMHVPIAQKVPGGGDRGPNVMPWPIYRLAKAMPVGKPLTLPSKYSGYGLRSRLSPDNSKWGPYTWKSSPYSGVIKTPQFPGQLRSPMQYGTIRTISRRSDPNSWIHPGFQARNLMDMAATNLDRIVPDIVERVLGGTL